MKKERKQGGEGERKGGREWRVTCRERRRKQLVHNSEKYKCCSLK